MQRTLLMWLLLFGFWIAWSGHTKPLLLTLGVFSCLLSWWIGERMTQVDQARTEYHLGFRPIGYAIWLMWEVVKSNLHVARVILSPQLPIQPQLLRVEANQKTELGRVIHANSITLTPGTITLDIRDGSVLVHALTHHTASGLKEGTMNRKVTALEGDVDV